MGALAKPIELHVELSLEAIADLCRRWRISRLEVFGSALRPDFSGTSDIDFLYTFRDEAHIGWDIVSVAEDFERTLGRHVDLVSRSAVERGANWIRRRNILDSAKTLYAE